MFRRCRKIIFGVLICLVSMPLVCVAANGGKAPAVATDADAEKLLGRGSVPARVRYLIARGDAERALQALVSAATLIAKTGANAHLAELHEARAAYALAFGGPWTRAEALTAAHHHYAALDAIAQVARLEIVIGGL